MRGALGIVLRVGVSLAILAALVFFISPRQLWQALGDCDWRWLLATVLLLPSFLALRIAKWHLLVRQTTRRVSVVDVIRGYLWGMAVGLLTPGRAGELARIWAAGLPSRCIGLFVLEKAVEITAIVVLCLLSLATLDVVPVWVPVGGLLLVATGVSVWRQVLKASARAAQRLLGRPSEDSLREFNWAVSRIRVRGCAILSLLCGLVFCLQSYLMLNSMGERYDLIVVRFVPVVFLANLAPITIGGLGLREAVAVFLLGQEGISAAAVVTSFVLVSIVNLFLPAVVGAALHSLWPRRCDRLEADDQSPRPLPQSLARSVRAPRPIPASPVRDCGFGQLAGAPGCESESNSRRRRAVGESQMRTVLITLPVSRESRYTTGLERIANVKPPLGLAYLAASLEEHNLPVEIIDAEASQLNTVALLDQLDALQADIVGMTCVTMCYSACRHMARKIKERRPACVVVVGGPHASLFPRGILADEPAIDLVVVGEGEQTIVELVEAFAHSRDLAEINGIVRRHNGEIITNPAREVESDLDRLPYPAWHKLPFDRYDLAPQWIKRTPVLTMVTSRGCPFQCTFCCKSVFGSRVRRRSPQSVVEELKVLKGRHGFRDVTFADDTFTLSKSWVAEFCALMIQEDLDLTWSCMSRVNTVTPEMLAQMKRAGCWSVFFGVECGNQEILDTLRKGIKLDQVRRAVSWAKEAGLEIQTTFMLALPGETPEIAMQTIRFAIELDTDYAKFNLTAPFPGTELYDQALKAGKIVDNLDEYTTQHPVFIPDGYEDPIQILNMKRKAFRMYYLRPRYILRRLSQIRSISDILRYFKGAKGYYAIVKG